MTDYPRLVREHHAVLYRIAHGILRDPASAEDAVQETYLDLLRRSLDPVRTDHPRAFLARCVIHRALMMRRADSRRDRREALGGQEAVMDPMREVFRREVRTRVDALPEDQRVAIDLHYLQGFSLAEVAAALAVSDRTVSTRLRDGLDRLKKALGAAGLAGLLGLLEGELRACEPVPVPEGLEARLLGLRAPRAGTGAGPVATRWPRFVAISAMFAVVLLTFLVRRGLELPAATGSDGGTPGLAVPSAPGSGEVTSVPAPERALDPAGSVCGIVVFEDGLPASGATVRIDLCRGNLLRSTSDSRRHLGVTPAAVTVTDGEGRFGVPVSPGPLEVTVALSGHAQVRLQGCATGDNLRIVLPASRILPVRVVTEDGAPVTGAQLLLGSNGWVGARVDGYWTLESVRGDYGDPQFRSACVTDQDGRADFAVPASPGDFRIRARHPEFAEQSCDVPADARQNQPLTITMARGKTLEGRVVDEEGRPVPGGTLRWQEWDSRNGLCTSMAGSETRADDQGAFRFRDWVEGETLVWCRAAGFAPVSFVVRSSPAEIRLDRGVTVTGRVVDRAGTPVPGAAVGAGALVAGTPDADVDEAAARSAAALEPCSPVVADAGGRFTLGDLPRGRALRIEAAAPGFVGSLVDLPPASGESIDAGDLVLVPGATVAGRVTLEGGQPWSRRELALKAIAADKTAPRSGSGPGDLELKAVTDSGGSFRFPGLAPGRYALTWQPEGWNLQTREVVVPPGSADVTVDIVLDTGWWLDLEVVDDTGAVVPGLHVDVLWEGGEVSGATDQAGLVCLRAQDDDVRVRVNHTFHKEYLGADPVPMQRRAGRRQLVLPSERRIAGRVLVSGGKADSIRVSVARSGPAADPGGDARPLETEPADDGTFEVFVRSADPVDVVAEVWFDISLPGGTEGRCRSFPARSRVPGVVPGTSDLEIRVQSPATDGTLTVRVESPDGAPWKNAGVWLEEAADGDDAGAWVGEFLTDASGAVRIEGLPRVRLRIGASPNVDPPGSIESSRTAEAFPDHQSLTLRLRKRLRVAGIVEDEDGRPLAGMQVRILDGDREVSACDSGADGTFEAWIPGETKEPTLEVGEEATPGFRRVENVDPRAYQTVRVSSRK